MAIISSRFTKEGVFLPDYVTGSESVLDTDALRSKYTSRVNRLYNPELEGGVEIDRRLLLDPRVLYRWAGKDAIRDFDATGRISGPDTGGYLDKSVQGQRSPFFSQGIPLWQYAGGIKAGTGTAIGEQNPYLIATVGADWTSRDGSQALGEFDFDPDVLREHLEQNRGLTRQFTDSYIETQKAYQGLYKDVEDIRAEGRELTPKQLENLKRKYLAVREKYLAIYDSLGEYFEGGNGQTLDDVLGTTANPASHAFGNMPDSRPSLEWLQKKGSKAQLKALAESLDSDLISFAHGRDFIENPTPDAFSLTSQKYSPWNGGEEYRFWLPPWVMSMDNSTGLIPSDSELMRRINFKGGDSLATFQELNAVLGLGRFDYELNDTGTPLRHMDLRRIGSGAMYSERLPSTRIQEASGGYGNDWAIPSAYVDTKDRPFAIWQYTKNGLRLVNQGNNSPINGSTPIPTERQDIYLAYDNMRESGLRLDPLLQAQAGKIRIEKSAPPTSPFSLTNVIEESTRGSPNYGRKGFVAIPKFLDKIAGEMALEMQTSPASNFAEALKRYKTDPQARQFVKSYTGQTANNAVKGLGLAAYAHGLANDAPSTIVAAGLPFTRFTGVGPVLPLNAGEDEYLYNRDHGLLPETKPREVNNAYLDYIYGFPSGM